MKIIKGLSVIIALILGLSLGLKSTQAATVTPSHGHLWSNSSITYYNDGSNTFYEGIWNTAQSRWHNTGIVSLTKGTKRDFRAGNKNAGAVSWDGIAEYSYNVYLTKVRAWVNTYYTSQSRYTTAIVNGLATHEIGHSLGLTHNNTSSSVMISNTFNSNGTLARTTSSPGKPDKTGLNNLYHPFDVASVAEAEESTSDNYVVLDPSWSIGYENITDLAQDADLIVEGTIGDKKELNKSSLSESDFTSYRTNREIKVNKVLKGDKAAKHTTITFDQLGGIDDTAEVISTDTTPLKKNEKVILFLQNNGNIYSLINEDESIYIMEKSSDEYKSLKKNLKMSKKEIEAKIK